MQAMLLDFLPVLLFFISFKLYGIYVATVVGIVVTFLLVLATRLVKKHFVKQQVLTLIVFAVFGGLTLYFHDPIFVKWKPTVIFWIFGIAFLATQVIGNKPLIQRILHGLLEEDNYSIPKNVWRQVNIAWGFFFLILGTVNIWVAYHFSTDAWVNFKVYGVLGMFLVFSLVQAVWLSRYVSEKDR